jgi:hypothetical protein
MAQVVNETLDVSAVDATQSTQLTHVNETLRESFDSPCKTVVVSFKGNNRPAEIVPDEVATTNERILRRMGCGDQISTGM